MPNLMLTTRCNLSCQYCFAVDFIRAEEKHADMTRETFLSLLEWLNKRAFPGRILHLMGGEPTLNKDFAWMAHLACDEGFDVAVFSNAATSGAARHIESLRDRPIRWIINVNPPATRSQETDKYLRESLSLLGERTTLTFNITPDDPPCDWVLDLISQYGLSKRIKIGLVLPTLSHQNQYLRREDYPKFAEKVVEFAQMCELFDVALEYECGIERCLFSAKQLGQLWRTTATFQSCCDSILDITPDGRVIYCLPLANLRQVHVTSFENYPAAKSWFESELNILRPLGSTANCHRCHLMKTGVCRGGCLARILGDAHNVHLLDARKDAYAATDCG